MKEEKILGGGGGRDYSDQQKNGGIKDSPQKRPHREGREEPQDALKEIVQ